MPSYESVVSKVSKVPSPKQLPLASSYLQIPAVSLPQLLEPEVSLAGIDGGWRSDTGTFAGRAGGDSFHGVEVFIPGSPLVDPLAGISAQWPHHTLAPAVGALGYSLDLVVVSQQLDTHRERLSWGYANTSSSRKLSFRPVKCAALARDFSPELWREQVMAYNLLTQTFP